MYSKELSDKLYAVCKAAGFKPQTGLLERYWSDSSQAQLFGGTGLSALLGLPTYNTHGFEMIHREGVAAMAYTLAAFLQSYDHTSIAKSDKVAFKPPGQGLHGHLKVVK